MAHLRTTLHAALLCLLLSGGHLMAEPPAWSAQAPIYEVNPEMYAAKDAFKAIQADLPRIKALGIGIVWLMPIQTRGVEKAINSPYCIKDFNGIYAPYGSESDFKALVKAAHGLGLHVIMDWVGNHSSWDNALVKEHPEFYAHDQQGRVAQVKTFADIAQFDYKQAGLRAWMIQSMLRWVKDFDVDGFRCDMAWNIPLDFWQDARAQLEKVKPVFMLAEENDPMSQGAFDADYDWNLMPAAPMCDLMRIARGSRPPTVIDEALFKEIAYPVPPDFYRLRYTSNHDEFDDVGTPGDTLGDADKALAVLVSTLPGKPLVYNGQELGWEGRIKGSKPAWNQPPDPVLDFSTTTRTAWYSGFYKRLLTLYQAMPQERNEVLVKLSSREDCRIYAFLRRNSANRILVLLNLSAEGATYSLSDDALAGDYKDLFSGASLHIGPTLSGSAAPWEYHVYVSGPQTEAAVAALASETPVAPTWDSKAPVSDKPCPTPVQIATPVAGRVPYQAVCGGSRPEKGWQKVDRLVIGINPDRVSARFKASWSEKSLDLQVEVQDPSVNNNLPNPWDDSSVEVYFNMSDSHAGNYGDGDFQYIFTFGRPDPFEAHQKLAGVTCTSSKTPGTWNIQASIPWSTLGVKPQPKKKYGFDLSVDYNQDGSGRQGQLTWHGSADDYHDTSLFSDLVLLPCR